MALNLIKKDKSHSVVSIKLDEQEFHNIFKEYYAALCSFAFQYMEDADMSADIVQQSGIYPFLSDLAPYLCFSGANIVKFSEYNQYNYQSSKSFPHKSISDRAFHKLHPTNSPIANKKIKYIIIVRFVSMSYNNTVNWIKVHSTQNCKDYRHHHCCS